MRCVPARATQHGVLALHKSGIEAWEQAIVEERGICMHLPEEELTNACVAGETGVLQLLEHVRMSLMLEGGDKEEEAVGGKLAFCPAQAGRLVLALVVKLKA